MISEYLENRTLNKSKMAMNELSMVPIYVRHKNLKQTHLCYFNKHKTRLKELVAAVADRTQLPKC